MALMTPVEVLQHAMAIGGWPSLISSRRYQRYQGRPGEIIEKLGAKERAVLKNLRSDDITEKNVDRYAAWLGYDGYYGEPGTYKKSTFRSMREIRS